MIIVQNKNISIKIGGPAGSGIKSVGSILAKTLSRYGFAVFEYPEYPSLIRGGHNTEQIVASDSEICSQIRNVDILLAFDQKTITEDLTEVKADGIVIYDSQTSQKIKKDNRQWIDLPMLKIARNLGNGLISNNVGVGAILALLRLKLKITKDIISEEFKNKKMEIIKINHLAVDEGYKYLAKQEIKLNNYLKPPAKRPNQILLTGNDAISLGAIAAGMSLYVSYPMTPSTSVLHFLAAHQQEYGYIVRQPEDEIAAVNMVLGAEFTGVRALTGTSGGGFALMNETLALSGISEIPVIIFLAQRPGPATGMPTWTEQGELAYAIQAGHGEFLRIVLAPGDLQEAFQLTADAFNLAERYQAPVIILSDKYLGESAMTTPIFNQNGISIDRGEVMDADKLKKITNFQRYQITKNGISPRSLPGDKNGIYVADSYEHDYHGLDNETASMRVWQSDKRLKKGITLANNMPGPALIGPQEADVTLITWGSSKLPALHCVQGKLCDKKINLLHFSYMWPMNREAVKKAFEKYAAKKTLMLEGNATGQFQTILKDQIGFEPTAYLRKYDGRPIYPEEIERAINQSA